MPRLRTVARFVPDCAVLFARLVRDPQLPRRRKAPLVLVAAYLAMPFDLIPDFIPVIGQLDDALIVALALRWVVRGAPPRLIEEHWPGPAESLQAVLRAGGTVDGPDGLAVDDRPDHHAVGRGVGDGGDDPRMAEAGRRPRRGR